MNIPLGGDYPPVADAGNSRIEWARIDGIATIQLDGSGSYDEDKDPLTYLWTWPGGSATGVNPTIQLTQGIYTIILDVNDGLNTAYRFGRNRGIGSLGGRCSPRLMNYSSETISVLKTSPFRPIFQKSPVMKSIFSLL